MCSVCSMRAAVPAKARFLRQKCEGEIAHPKDRRECPAALKDLVRLGEGGLTDKVCVCGVGRMTSRGLILSDGASVGRDPSSRLSYPIMTVRGSMLLTWLGGLVHDIRVNAGIKMYLRCGRTKKGLNPHAECGAFRCDRFGVTSQQFAAFLEGSLHVFED